MSAQTAIGRFGIPCSAVTISAGSTLHIHRAETWMSRLRGLLFRPALLPDEALMIAPCNSVHTIGMHYAIDVVFTDRDGTILAIRAALAPYRMASCLRANRVFELPAGRAAALGLAVGERLDAEFGASSPLLLRQR